MKLIFNHKLSWLGGLGLGLALSASAQVTLYEHENYGGRRYTSSQAVSNLSASGYNDRASSVEVVGARWELCEHARYGGQCRVLRAGRYPSLAALGLDDQVSSLRLLSRNARIDPDRYAPEPAYDPRRRGNERLYQARVSAVQAVLGPPERRCWIEREQWRPDDRDGGSDGSSNNSSSQVPAALAGAVIGGILGHQVGGGSGKQIATAGGVVAGALIGARLSRDSQQRRDDEQRYDEDRDGVRRCSDQQQFRQRPAYWNVSYEFRGQPHQIQMDHAPGDTITVNRRGEPRI